MSTENPALISEAPQPVEKQYTVTGIQAVLGNAPGTTFTAKFTTEMESYYIEGGHISLVSEASGSTDSSANVKE